MMTSLGFVSDVLPLYLQHLYLPECLMENFGTFKVVWFNHLLSGIRRIWWLFLLLTTPNLNVILMFPGSYWVNWHCPIVELGFLNFWNITENPMKNSDSGIYISRMQIYWRYLYPSCDLSSGVRIWFWGNVWGNRISFNINVPSVPTWLKISSSNFVWIILNAFQN